jgi:hypothetical protein
MKKALLVLCIPAIFGFCAVPSFAGSEPNTTDNITLAASPRNSFVFKGAVGGGFTLSLVDVLGNAAGEGTLASTGKYSITEPKGDTISSAATGCGTGCFNLNQSAPLTFKYGSTANNGSLLQGTLELVSIDQTPSGKGGLFNDSAVVDLTITGGSLAGKFGADGIVQITINFTTTQNLSTITPKQVADANITSGTVDPILPEPGSLALLGTGLVSLGGVVRLFKLQLRG